MSSKPLSSFKIIVIMLFMAWSVMIINAITATNLNAFGLLPRDFTGLIGLVTMPFLHGDWPHLIGNTFAFVILGWLASIGRRDQLLKLTLFVAIIGGILLWLFGRTSYHIGLSLVIFGYWGFVVANGWFERSFKAIMLSLFTVIFYGGMIWQVLPTSPGVSFEGHFFGVVAGVLYSYTQYKNRSLSLKK